MSTCSSQSSQCAPEKPTLTPSLTFLMRSNAIICRDRLGTNTHQSCQSKNNGSVSQEDAGIPAAMRSHIRALTFANFNQTILKAVELAKVRKTPFWSHFYTNPPKIGQDRLGTNIGKVEGKGGFCRASRCTHSSQCSICMARGRLTAPSTGAERSILGAFTMFVPSLSW